MKVFARLFLLHQETNAQSGQAGLIVLLLTVVLLTIGVSVASRATKDLTQSRQEEESNQVLYAAETGIEQALSEVLTFSGTRNIVVDGNAVTYTIRRLNTLNTYLFEGVSAQVNLPGSAGNVSLSWLQNCDAPASMMVTIINSAGTSRTFAYNPNCSSQPLANGNGFTSTSSNASYRGVVSVPVVSGDVMFRIKPLYNNAHVLVSGSNFGDQMYNIRSSAVNSTGTEQRVVEVNRTLPAVPSFMDYAIYSGTTITTN